MPATVHDGNNNDCHLLDSIVNAERETMDQCAMCAARHHRIHGRLVSDRCKRTANLIQELVPETGALSLILLRSILEITLGLDTKPNWTGQSIFLTLVSTTSASCPISPSAS